MDKIIFTAADGNYHLQAQTLMLSLVKTQKSRTRLLIFGNGWSDREIRNIKNLQNDTVEVEINSVPIDQFSSIRLASNFPLATAYNVLAPDFLLKLDGKVLYVDADVVVTEDISNLLDRNMTSPVGAVLDAHIGWISSPSMWRPWREENIPPLTPYLNTGVMLIDLDEWRKNKLTNRIIEVLTRYELPCVDQDAINIVLRGEFDQLEPRYNLMPYHYLKMLRYVDALETDEDLRIALESPAIIHFHRSFLGKPWTIGAIHPATKLWRSLATEAHPGWRKSLDITGYIRRRGAKFANMLQLDERGSKISSL